MSVSKATWLLALCLWSPLWALAQSPGDAGSGTSTPDPNAGNQAGAAGGNSSSFDLPRGAMIAIIVVAVVVGLGGIGSAILFYIAKKRQWEIRKSLRRSARRLTGSFNPTKDQRSARRHAGIVRLNDGGKPSRIVDLEKAPVKVTSSFDVESPPPAKTWSKVFTGFGKNSRAGR